MSSAAPAQSTGTGPPLVSGRWLFFAVLGVLAASAVCVWAALCLLFWQGSWQLLYHPSSTVARTPASAGMPFDPVDFATDGSGTPRLTGWWVAAAPASPRSRYTVLYLHGQDGNLSNTIGHLEQLHAAGVNVFAFDYRGYGQSRFARPSEVHWLEDAGWALDYLAGTRHIDPRSIVVYGWDLGANLALELAAAHPELAGVVLNEPIKGDLTPIFDDPRAKFVPAHWLVRDRFDLDAAAAEIHVSVLWFESDAPSLRQRYGEPSAYRKITSRKTLVWLAPSPHPASDKAAAFTRWLDDLPAVGALR